MKTTKNDYKQIKIKKFINNQKTNNEKETKKKNS